MKLWIAHETRYQHGQPVEASHHLAHLTPLSRNTQRVIGHALTIDPQPAHCTTHHDAFGNQVCLWELLQTRDHLCVTAQSEVQTLELLPAHSSVTFAQAQDHGRYRSHQPVGAESVFAFPSRHVPRHEAFAQYAQADFAPQRPLVEAACAWMHRMHAEMAYDHHSTQVDTPALMALQARRGVCQDFAHLMLAGLRQMGLSACYVSGYLLTQAAPGQPRMLGADASHAWVALFVPGLHTHPSGGWLHLDPTNDRCGWGSPGEDYVIVACGRDFADVSPLRGMLRGGDAAAPEVKVTVECLA
jgi:transglutaminase-like putative cysteine protease